MNTTDKILLVTGGSRGIGAATALLAAERGYAVAVNYRSNRDGAEEIAETIRSNGGRSAAVEGDVANEADIVEMFRRVDDQLGRLTALVNNAGVIGRQGRVEDMDAERLNRVLTTNVTGSFLCAREAIKRMSTRHGGNGGAIVNVSSAAARLGSGGEFVDYAASKGAVDTMTVGLATELADDGIRVNAVRPGIIYTDIHAAAGEPGRVDRLKAGVPMKRGGTPQEVANAILWLLSDDASYTTGSFIEVSGGR